MKYDTFLRRIFDAAYIALKTGQDIEVAMEAARQQSMFEAGVPDLNLRISEVIIRDEGPMVTACLSIHQPFERFADIDAAGIVRLRSNHRVIVTRYQQLGSPGEDRFKISFVEGDSQITADGKVQGGHRPVPPFQMGDLSGTDKSFHYLLSRAVLGDQEELRKIGELPFPLPEEEHNSIFGRWLTDEALFAALARKQAA